MFGELIWKITVIQNIHTVFPDEEDRELAFKIYRAFMDIEGTGFRGAWVGYGLGIGALLFTVGLCAFKWIFKDVQALPSPGLQLVFFFLSFALGPLLLWTLRARPLRKKAVSRFRETLRAERGRIVLVGLKQIDPNMEKHLAGILQ